MNENWFYSWMEACRRIDRLMCVQRLVIWSNKKIQCIWVDYLCIAEIVQSLLITGVKLLHWVWIKFVRSISVAEYNNHFWSSWKVRKPASYPGGKYTHFSFFSFLSLLEKAVLEREVLQLCKILSRNCF